MTTNPTKQVALEDLVETKTVTMTCGDLVTLYNAAEASPATRTREAAARLVALLDDDPTPPTYQPGGVTTRPATEVEQHAKELEQWRQDLYTALGVSPALTPGEIAAQVRQVMVDLAAERQRAEDAEAALAGLPEWHCPNCGATTRARMADHQHEPAYEYSVDYGGITWPAPTREAAIRIAAGSTSGEARVIRRTLGEWEDDPTANTTQDGAPDA